MKFLLCVVVVSERYISGDEGNDVGSAMSLDKRIEFVVLVWRVRAV